MDGYSRKNYCLKLQEQDKSSDIDDNTNNNPKMVAPYYMDYIRGMQILPRVVRADENVITRELQIFSEDAILMKCTR